VQGERNGKRKNNVFAFTLPNRSLPYLKVVQGERNGKRKNNVFAFTLPNRSLHCLMIDANQEKCEKWQMAGESGFSPRQITFLVSHSVIKVFHP